MAKIIQFTGWYIVGVGLGQKRIQDINLNADWIVTIDKTNDGSVLNIASGKPIYTNLSVDEIIKLINH